MSTRAGITPAMHRELVALDKTGEPSDFMDSGAPPVLWFWARDRVLTALLRRELINGESGDYVLTAKGREALTAGAQ